MRRLACLALLMALLVVPPVVTMASAESLYVKVRATSLRAEPKQWASAVANLRYGDSLKVISTSGAWHSVQSGNKTGYVHNSALSERKIVLKASDAVAAGDDRDVVLAGKGFNKEVERGYAASNRSLNYSQVDIMERRTVSDSEIASFIRAGKLEGS